LTAVNKSANIVGLGLIGGSIASGLVERGWSVHGSDLDSAVVVEAKDLGLIMDSVLDPDAVISIVATPVSTIPNSVSELLAGTRGAVTDVGSVKASVMGEVNDPRFVGGHPMAGSELSGLAGVDPHLFVGAVWVLTPGTHTSDETFEVVASVVRDLGAEVVTTLPSVLDLETALALARLDNKCGDLITRDGAREDALL
jgi:prephenate dehydrogenase